MKSRFQLIDITISYEKKKYNTRSVEKSKTDYETVFLLKELIIKAVAERNFSLVCLYIRKVENLLYAKLCAELKRLS